jgi:hypothetical protein
VISQEATLERPASIDSERLTHLAAPPYTHAYCGTPRGTRTLKPLAAPTCVVCLDLKAQRGAR